MMRAVWTQDPVTFEAQSTIPADDQRDDDAAAARIIRSRYGWRRIQDAALKRTTRIADGWHGTRYTPESEAAPVIKRLRADRPGADFTDFDARRMERPRRGRT